MTRCDPCHRLLITGPPIRNGDRVDDAFEQELERRLLLLESPGGGGMILPDLPWRDVAAAILGIVATITVMLWWAY